MKQYREISEKMLEAQSKLMWAEHAVSRAEAMPNGSGFQLTELQAATEKLGQAAELIKDVSKKLTRVMATNAKGRSRKV